MKLLLDSMYQPVIASQMQRRGHDIIAARADSSLEDLSDPAILAFARDQRRVLITENMGDFVRIDVQWRREGLVHCGVILVDDYKYQRRHGAGIGRLIRALEAWLIEHPGEANADSQLWWL